MGSLHEVAQRSSRRGSSGATGATAVSVSIDGSGSSTSPSHSKLKRPSGRMMLWGTWLKLGRVCSWKAFILLILFFFFFQALFLFPSSSKSAAAATRTKYAYVCLLCDDQMAQATAVLVYSVKRTGTPHDIVILAMPAVTQPTVDLLTAVGARIEWITQPVPYPFLIRQNRLAINKPCRYSKLLMWKMVEYRKIVYLDVDMLVMMSIDELFQHPELSAVPDSIPPDTFNSGLMVIQPSLATFQDMLSKVNSTPSPNVGDQGFLNEYFHDWYRKGPEHRLHYGYNALVRLSRGASWKAWVEPKMKVLHFSGAGKPWNMRMDEQQVTVRQYDHLWWQALYEMQQSITSSQGEAGKVPPPVLRAECKSDYMAYSLNANSSKTQRYSVLLDARFAREDVLGHLVRHYSAMRIVSRIYVLLRFGFGEEEWGEAIQPGEQGGAQLLSRFRCRKNIEVVIAKGGSMHDRLRPLPSLETECILLCTADVEVPEQLLNQGYKRWRENKYRLVGYYAASHWRDIQSKSLMYDPSPRVEYSMLLTRVLFMHADFLRAYTCQTPKNALDFIDDNPQCLDVMFNLIITQLNGLTPLLVVTPTKKDFSPTASGLRFGSKQLSSDLRSMGSLCLNASEHILGHMQLKMTSETFAVFDGNAFVKATLPSPPSPPPSPRAPPATTHLEGGQDATWQQQQRQQEPSPDATLSTDKVEDWDLVNALDEEEEDDSLVIHWDPIFEDPEEGEDSTGFMSSVDNALTGPELAIAPSEKSSGGAVVCITGNDSQAFGKTSNSYTLVDPSDIPQGTLRLGGTTYVVSSTTTMLSRLPLLDRLANLFQHVEDSGGFGPSRILVYLSGGLITSLSRKNLDLMWAVMGDVGTFGAAEPPLTVVPFAITEAERPHCLERMVLIRRCRPHPSAALNLLSKVRERVSGFCLERKGKAAGVEVSRLVLRKGDEGGDAEGEEGGREGEEQEQGMDLDVRGKDEMEGMRHSLQARGEKNASREVAGEEAGKVYVMVVENADNYFNKGVLTNARQLAEHLAQTRCGQGSDGDVSDLCVVELVSFAMVNDLCSEVAAMERATILVGAHGDALHSLVVFLPPASIVVEVANSDGKGGAMQFPEHRLEATVHALGLQFQRVVEPGEERKRAIRVEAPILEVSAAVADIVKKLGEQLAAERR